MIGEIARRRGQIREFEYINIYKSLQIIFHQSDRNRDVIGEIKPQRRERKERDLKFVGDFLVRDAIEEGIDHPRIDLDGDHAAGGVEEFDGEVAGAGADLEDGVGGEDAGFADDGVENTGISEYVLASALVELELAEFGFFFFVRNGVAADSSTCSVAGWAAESGDFS